MKTLVAWISLTLVGAAWTADLPAPKFTKTPTVVKKGDRATITFAVDRETDVAVFIEDGRGKVVRHLVAGVLGTNAPPPLKSGSLEQSVEWDGKADYGREVSGFRIQAGTGSSLTPSPLHPPPFRLRVVLGLSVKYDKVLVSEAQNLGASAAWPWARTARSTSAPASAGRWPTGAESGSWRWTAAATMSAPWPRSRRT